MGTSSLWKIPAARATSALVFSKTSEKCSTVPASLEAIFPFAQDLEKGYVEKFKEHKY